MSAAPRIEDGRPHAADGGLPPAATAGAVDLDVAANLARVHARIGSAARRVGRDPGGIRLIAVSKGVPADRIRLAIAAGHRDFGENRVQEAAAKIPAMGDGLRWHLVGHLQSNKARKAVGLFQYIHSVDGVDLLRRLDSSAEQSGVTPAVLVQVDLAAEPTKHGSPVPALAGLFEEAVRCRALRPAGLMVLPPFSEDPEGARPYFRRLRELAGDLIRSGVRPDCLRELSMGMSHDLEVAVEEGATMVRVGTAIFGERPA